MSEQGGSSGRTPSPNDCAGCGHVAAHHTRRDSVYAGLMADYRVVWRCAWRGCGCPEYVKARARVLTGGLTPNPTEATATNAQAPQVHVEGEMCDCARCLTGGS